MLKSRNKDGYRYEIGFLSKHIWKEWTQYISGKYIEMGKGVYHFAIPDLSGNLEGEPISICEVKPEYRNGVSGFDYERIRAEESLEREMEKYVLFAVNNFARAVTPEEEREKSGHEDVLLMKTLSEIEESQTKEERQKNMIIMLKMRLLFMQMRTEESFSFSVDRAVSGKRKTASLTCIPERIYIRKSEKNYMRSEI